MKADRTGALVVIDDDASRHPDLDSWALGLGCPRHIVSCPQSVPPEALARPLSCLVVHAGYGKHRKGFPRRTRPAEAIRWLLGDRSYLAHEDLEAMASLGSAIGHDVPIALVTGGSVADLPLADLRAIDATRRIVAWNVFSLLATPSVGDLVAGHRAGSGTTRPLASQVRHDLLNRLWNLAIEAAELHPDPAELARIVRGDLGQAPLRELLASCPALDAAAITPLMSALAGIEASSRQVRTEGLATLAHAAIELLETGRG